MRARLALVVLWIFGAAASGAAQEVGIAILVQPSVRAYPPRGERSYELKERNPIDRGLKVRLQDPESLLRIAFTRGFGCVTFSGPQFQSISGVLKLRGPSEIETADPSRPCEPRLKLNSGKLWLAKTPGQPPVEVETPDVVVGVKGTLLRMLVDPTVGTFLAVDEGLVTVQAKAGGLPVEVAAGQWVQVPTGGFALPPSLITPGGPESRLDFGEPLTDPPGVNPGERPVLDLPKSDRP